MAQVYVHCSSDRQAFMDRGATDVADLTEARDFAEGVVRSLVTAPSLEDWRTWAVHVHDDLGDEIFVVPFVAVLGKPN